MSTFYHSDDPLLKPWLHSQEQQQEQTMMNNYRQQLWNQMAQQQQSLTHDYIGKLDIVTKDLDKSTINKLSNNPKYVELNNKIQDTIQEEIVNIIKDKLNNNKEVVEAVKQQLDIIKHAKNEIHQEERESISEMQDYMKNYSNMTFDEYKKIKNKENEN